MILLLYIVVEIIRRKQDGTFCQHDALTGVYNRENTQKMIDAILREKAPEGFHGFLILDMDHFKEVNDVYGHVMGDNVLRMLGGFLKEQFREQDVIGRIGGDEFVILLCNIGSRENMESRIKIFMKISGRSEWKEWESIHSLLVQELLLHHRMEIPLWNCIKSRSCPLSGKTLRKEWLPDL